MSTPSLIFDIKRYAIHDGPGVRITIFLKGCPLSCKWCHNPEGMSRKVQKMYTEKKCIGAQECIRVCPENALALTPEGIVTDVEKCTLCGECAEVCPTKAIEMSGQPLTVDELMQVIRRETLLMDQSGGGVTFSGGEPLHHHRFLRDILDACGAEGIHRCVDTTGFANLDVLMDIAGRTDLFLYDLKMMDPEKHKDYTGVSNKRILENLAALSATDVEIIIRIPLIRGVNDDDENIRETATFLAGLPGPKRRVQILPYHSIAEGKYVKLGMAQPVDHFEAPAEERVKEVLGILRSFGLEVEIGG